MTHAPTSDMPHTFTGPGRVIGLFLARLLTYLVRLHNAGQTEVDASLADMTRSAHDMVQAYIRALAAARLKAAGYRAEADALRAPTGRHTPPAPSRSTAPAATAELIAQLQSSLESFERAEALASALTFLIICVHGVRTAHAPVPGLHIRGRCEAATETRRVSVNAPAPRQVSRGPPGRASPPWPPPRSIDACRPAA